MMPTAQLTPPPGEGMVQFSQKTVMGTIFETTQRLDLPQPVRGVLGARILRFYEIATQTGSLLALACLDLSGIVLLVSRCERRELISLFFIQLR
jgi:hypothetical protein